MNTLDKLENLSKSEAVTTRIGAIDLVMSVKKETEGIYSWRTKIRNGRRQPFESEIKETSFPIKTITNTLKEMYSSVSVNDWMGRDISESSRRVLFVCLK